MLITSDLHLTSKIEDEYRWGIFDFIQEQTVLGEPIFILGDLTDSKDRHPSTLVNKIVAAMKKLCYIGHDVIIIKGNHDYVDSYCPFFQFLDSIEGDGTYVQYVTIPEVVQINNKRIFCIPHTHKPEDDWSNKIWDTINEADYVFMHQTFTGAKASNGVAMEGISPKLFKKIKARVISGDIHVPQNIGNITYVGSPYHVHFGDDFKPRLIQIDDDGREKDLHFKTIRKVSAKIRSVAKLDDLNLKMGDQLKVTYTLPRSDFSSWASKKDEVVQYCEKRGVSLFGIDIQEIKRNRLKSSPVKDETATLTTQEIYDAFCKRENLAKQLYDVGGRYL